MDIQRLRNLTTGRLHTEMRHIYEDMEAIVGESLLTHMLPRALVAIEPWLRANAPDERLWNGQHDPSHTGDVELPEPTSEERAAMFDLYKAQPNPLAGKNVIVVER